MMRKLVLIVATLLIANTVSAENWTQFRRDERHSGWATLTLDTPLHLVYDGTLRWYKSGWVPSPAVQVDNLTIRNDTVMLMGSVAGGDPKQAHGAARWAAYLSRSKNFANAKPGGQAAYRPSLYFLESITPKAGIETDSGHHPCQFSMGLTDAGGWMMESGFLKFSGNVVSTRMQSDIFGPSICRDDDSEGLFISRQQWHGGGMYARRQPMRSQATGTGTLWAQWGAVPDGDNSGDVLGYTIAYDAVYAGQYLVSNFVTSVGNPKNLPKNYEFAPEVSGLCSWQLNPQQRLSCRPGSWGQLATDGIRLWTYEQTPYERIPDGYWQVGGASRKLVALSIPDLVTIFEADVGNIPLNVQDAPLVGPSVIATIAYHNDQPFIEAYDQVTFTKLWSRTVPIVPRSGGCAYWPARGTEQVVLAASGDTIVVASNGISVLDATTGELLFQDKLGTTYFNPVIADGQLFVLRDDSGPGQDPVTNNCSGNALEVWAGVNVPTIPLTPPPTAKPTLTGTATRIPTRTATETRTATRTRTPRPTRTPTTTRTGTRTASPTRTPSAAPASPTPTECTCPCPCPPTAIGAQ